MIQADIEKEAQKTGEINETKEYFSDFHWIGSSMQANHRNDTGFAAFQPFGLFRLFRNFLIQIQISL
ncbi:MAG: hypothetical protein IPJ07_18765 [Acidobacteria bacterium]|nr:hypothetical protein [Acidobacteriota bacterium]